MKRLLIVVCLLLLPTSALAQEEDPGVVTITSPTTDAQLFGLVEIRGTVTHPSLFDGYILEWSNIQNPDVWLPIQQRVNQQVTEGLLGQWDTVLQAIPDGLYQIRVQMLLTDGSVQTAQVENLNLVNSAPTPLPTPVEQQAPDQVEPQPTTIIEQPPTAQPLPTTVPSLNTSSEGGSSDAIFNFSALQSAFCSGVYFSAILFALIVGYLLVRSQVSPYTRRLWWQIRSEFEDDRDN